MQYQQIIKDLKNKIYHPIYLLQGEEPFFIDKISDYIQNNVLSEGEQSFNLTILYGKDAEALTTLDIVKRYPMMGNYQVVILREAQDMKGLDKLMDYLSNPLESTIFVICYKYKKLPKTSKILKALSSKAVVYTSQKHYENQMPFVISAMVKQSWNREITHRAVMLLTEFVGSDLGKIEKELEKLALNVDQAEKIDLHHIEKYIGISKDYNVFELTKAIANKDSRRTFSILEYFKKNPKPNPPVKIMGALSAFVTKAYIYKKSKSIPEKQLIGKLRTYPIVMKDIKSFDHNYSLSDAEQVVSILQEYDMKSKGLNDSTANKSDLLPEMAYKILNCS